MERRGPAEPYSERPENVGVLALEVYFPSTKVEQAELEIYDKVPAGKYTVGLGQHAMAFTQDQEDVVSLSMTAVQSLLEKYHIRASQVGRLEVGTESSVDRSKSVKSFLMALFTQSGNHDVQGVDCVNACYGGTAALFNAVNWIESRSWDGRYALVVAADVAIYEPGPARATGGCGAVAMLIGPDAPLVLEPGLSAAHMDNVYDFYKPAGLFPQVEGKLSIACYLTALDHCYTHLCQKAEHLRERQQSGTKAAMSYPFSLADVDYCVMHAPYAKLVRKAFARLVLHDCLRDKQRANLTYKSASPPAMDFCQPIDLTRSAKGAKCVSRAMLPTVEVQAHSSARQLASHHAACQSRTLESGSATKLAQQCEDKLSLKRLLDDVGDDAALSLDDKRIEIAAIAASAADFDRMAAPGMLLGLECGNMYAASVHAGLASLVYSKSSALEGKRILINSFGSGLAASVFCIEGRAVHGRFSLHNIACKLNLEERLRERAPASPEAFTAALIDIEHMHGKSGLKPNATDQHLFPGTFYLSNVDEHFRRHYRRK